MTLKVRTRQIARFLPFPLWGAGGFSLLFVLLAGLLFIFSAFQPGFVQAVRVKSADLLAPFLATASKPVFIVSEYVRGVSGLAKLQEENAKLRLENERLREWYDRAQTLGAENEVLRKNLHMKFAPSLSFITTEVIADSGDSFMRSLLLPSGTDAGVEKGHAVVTSEGVIGRIIEVGKNTSRVLLLTDMNSRIPVIILGMNLKAIVAGNNTDLAEFDYLPADVYPPVGARVITSGHGGVFPYGLPVGTVVKDEAGKIFVKPYAEESKAHFVRIINTSSDPLLRRAAEGQGASDEMSE